MYLKFHECCRLKKLLLIFSAIQALFICSSAKALADESDNQRRSTLVSVNYVSGFETQHSNGQTFTQGSFRTEVIRPMNFIGPSNLIGPGNGDESSIESDTVHGFPEQVPFPWGIPFTSGSTSTDAR